MKTSSLILLLFILMNQQSGAQCTVTTKVFGQVQTDINRGYEMIRTSDSNFVIAGEWNNQAYLLKVDGNGTQLALKFYGAQIGGTRSFFRSLVENPDGSIVAVGECENCTVPNDSLTKVVAIKTDANLNLDAGIGVKKFGTVTVNGFTTPDERTSPVIRRNGNGYLMASNITIGLGLNPDDVLATQLSSTLASQWDKIYSTGYFDGPYDMAATANGFALAINRAFASALVLNIDDNGNELWRQPVSADLLRGITYLPASDEIVAIGERTPSGQDKQACLLRLDAVGGSVLDSLLFGDTLGDEGYDVQLMPDGNLMAAVRTALPNPFGTYGTSRIYHIPTASFMPDCYYVVPNPDNITSMSVSAVVPLSATGKDFAAAGIRGFNNRTFFHSRQDCETNPHFATICQGQSFPFDDQSLTQSGVYTATFPAANGCDSVVTLTLNVLPIAASSINATICQGETYLFNEQSLTQSGVYVTTLPAVNGCDSVVTLTLNVIPVDTSVNDQEYGKLVANATNAEYIWFDCNTGEVLGDSAVFIPEESGYYAVIVTQNGCRDSSSCHYVILSATMEPGQGLGWVIQPNPASDKVQFIRPDRQLSDVSIRIADVTGRVIWHSSGNSGYSNIIWRPEGAGAGMYFYTIQNDSGGLQSGCIVLVK